MERFLWDKGHVDEAYDDFLITDKAWTALLNPERRAILGETVVEILRNDMKRAEVANEAADLWNSLE